MYECVWAHESTGVCMVECVCLYVWLCASVCMRMKMDGCAYVCGCEWYVCMSYS